MLKTVISSPMKYVVTIFCLVVFSTGAQAGLLVNEDFETGTLAGWTTFTTANGILGPVAPVASFDTTGSGISQAAQFRVGQVLFTDGVHAGGGIFQNVNLAAGSYSLSLDIASLGGTSLNSSGGLFQLLFDNVVVDSHDTGSISSGSIERSILASVQVASAGLHEVRIQITRPYLQADSTPLQYVDNVILLAQSSSVPAPSVLALMVLGLLSVGFSRRNKV